MSKVRIYELSRELNLDNKDILGICEQLSIAAKSHSSTITESQAERIRASAERTFGSQGNGKTRGNGTATKEQDSGFSKPVGRNQKPRQQQQILEVRKQSRRSELDSDEQGASASSPPELVAPPPRPTNSPQSPADQLKTKPQPNQSSEATAQPTQARESSAQEEPPTPATNNQTEQEELPIQTPPEPAKPKLISPPARPKPEASQPPKPQSPSTQERPILKRAKKAEAPAPVSESTQTATPGAPSEAKPKAKPPRREAAVAKQAPEPPKPLPKPQRPEKPKPPQVSKPSKEELAPTVEEEEEDLTEETLLEPPERPQPKLKKPSPRPQRTPEWEEEDEVQKKKNKGGVKAKRRPKPIVDEDEEDIAASLEELEASGDTEIGLLSIQRPPKPDALQKPVGKPATAKPKKQPAKAKAPSDRQREKKVTPERPEKITLVDGLTVRDLAEQLQVAETEIIKSLFFKGLAVNITQTLDLQTARTIAEEMGVQVETPQEKAAAAKTEMLDSEDLENLQPRPPVVTIMGHVDHGKTSLLDAIRKTKVAQGEAGGITQHIGAYHVDVEHDGETKQVVFLDTPGHEAFTSMRARGARVTDIAILVVAADDGVQPQTREAISHAKAAGVPIVVAINKIDKPEAEPERVKQELTEQGLVPEEWGGETIMVPVSAIQGENLDTLLEMILLVAEIEELSANPDRLARGTVIEANLDRARGPVATLLVQNGTLRVGDSIVAGSTFGKIRAMIDDRGDRVEAASPSFAVEVLGLNDVPAAGDEFQVFADEKQARAIAEERAQQQRQSRLQRAASSRRVTLSGLSAQAQEGELKELNLIVKADVQGSLEAILGALEQLPQREVQVRVLLAAPGEVTETDVDLAAASGAVIIGFNTTLASGSKAAADQEGVDIRQYDIIYKLLDDIQGAMEGLLEPEEVESPLGQAQVRAVFPVGRGAVAGCYVQSGRVVRNRNIRVRRGDRVVFEGTLDSLKRMKDDVKEVAAGYECGIGSNKFNDWQEGDIIEAFEMVMKRRTLSTSA